MSSINVHSLFVEKEEDEINFNQENEQFHTEAKKKILEIDNDVVKFGKKVRKLKNEIKAQETAFAVLSQDVIDVTDLTVNLRVALQDIELYEKTLINKININFNILNNWLDRLGGYTLGPLLRHLTKEKI